MELWNLYHPDIPAFLRELTEAPEMQRLRAEYLPQLALYREALEGVTGQTVKKAVLYCFGIDKELSIDEQS